MAGYFVMLGGRGTRPKKIHACLLDLLPKSVIVWAGTGESLLEPSRLVKTKTWDLAAVLQTKDEKALKALHNLHTGMFVVEIEETSWKPSLKEDSEAKLLEPGNEPAGLREVFKYHWLKLLTIQNAIRNVQRVFYILLWALYHFGTGQMWGQFHMINLLKFDDGEYVYDLYRDAAGKLITSQGGSIAYMARVKPPNQYDELMIVHYKSRFQFLRMALFTPAYWPLCILRDEGLSDSMLHAVTPLKI